MNYLKIALAKSFVPPPIFSCANAVSFDCDFQCFLRVIFKVKQIIAYCLFGCEHDSSLYHQLTLAIDLTRLTFFGFNFSDMINLSPCSNIDAVPSRKYRPPDVTGLDEVAGRLPDSAVCNAPLLPVTGRFVPGLEYPDIGLPVFVTGRTIGEILLELCELVNGFSSDVPGRGALATAFSSM